ncbi:MAG: type VI-A CRISPR-associated RNA-guided ribonuclease Cas13a [Lachnospiraceae bacterium]|nr:type VI-A CRISPR-associated RNA-guided ribonuclease Cas13a [Lachnospiraceae bacterium]
MKVTKVGRVRFGVSRVKRDTGRGILYETPKLKGGTQALEKQLAERIQSANRLYGVFFASDFPRDLEEHFKGIVSRVRDHAKEDIRRTLAGYTGYIQSGRDGSRYEKRIDKFSYSVPSKKNPDTVMRLFVRERMTDYWQQKDRQDAAVEILSCICAGKKYRQLLQVLPDTVLTAFRQACLNCDGWKGGGEAKIFVPSNISGIRNVSWYNNSLEKYFSVLMETMAKLCRPEEIVAWQSGAGETADACIERQVRWLSGLSELEVYESKKVNGKTERYPVRVPLEDIRWRFATDDRMEAVLVRMRRALKRESNGRVAMRLMQGLAQMNGQTLHSVVEDMKKDPQAYAELKKFIGAVDRNYHKTDILNSLRRMDVKVQVVPREEYDEEASGQLDLSSVLKKEKAVLGQTLERYASSEAESAAVLLDIKRLLFTYFRANGNLEKYLNPDKLMLLPTDTSVYFDDEFDAPEAAGGREAGEPLSVIWNDEGRKHRITDAKKRIKYVNYGIYLRCRSETEDEFQLYWLRFIKDYVEKHYTGKARISEGDCFSSRMMAACWADILRFLCGKYIDIGKAVYHFAMPERKEGEIRCGQVYGRYRNGISSFDYEAIKAEETLQRDISVALMPALHAFSASVLDEEKRNRIQAEAEAKASDEDSRKSAKAHFEDVLLLSEDELEELKKNDRTSQLLRFYGGCSAAPEAIWGSETAGTGFMLELRQHLAEIRNENFHYTEGKRRNVNTKYTRILWENDRAAYADSVRKRYYSNNTGMFYDAGELAGLVRTLYGRSSGTEAQIPAFRNIWKRRALSDDINQGVSAGKQGEIPDFLLPAERGSATRTVFEGAVYFLLKEIYYRDFIQNRDVKTYFFNAAREYQNETRNDRTQSRPVQNFNQYLDGLKKISNGVTFGNLCQMIMQEYSQQNANQKEGAIYQHYKMLFPIYIKKAFRSFLNDHYGFLMKPEYREISGEPHYLDEVPIRSMEFPEQNPELSVWYTFAHFIHPKQLNLLVGDLKNYIQYRQDILKREESVSEAEQEYRGLVKEKREKTQQILDVLEFVRVLAGRVSACHGDYYDDSRGQAKEEYAVYLNRFIDFGWDKSGSAFDALKDFCQNTLPGDAAVDLYADAENPKLLRNIEIARMYAGGDLPLPGRGRVTAEEIRQYYQQKPKIEAILAGGLCEREEDQKNVSLQQQRKGRLTLNDVTEIYGLINDLLGQLVSLAYLRERDQMYLLLGFYYMALRSAQSWTGEELQTASFKNISVSEGLVLYQVVSVFDYGTPLPYPSGGKWKTQGGQLGPKLSKFNAVHEHSLTCAMRLFGSDGYNTAAVEARNYIDHGHYFAKHTKSMIDLYNEYYRSFFWYSRKLRNSVVHNLQTALERCFIEASLDFQKDGFRIRELKSIDFTCKLKEGKTCKCPARDSKYTKELKAVLEYRQ